MSPVVYSASSLMSNRPEMTNTLVKNGRHTGTPYLWEKVDGSELFLLRLNVE